MTTLAQLDALTTASKLIGMNLRLTIVGALTGVSDRTLRKLWREIHGKSSSNGKLPESVLSFITSRQAAADIAAFMGVYLHQCGPVKTIDPNKLMHALELCSRMSMNININIAYYGLRDLRAGFISFPKCSGCGARFIFDTEKKHTNRCPFCNQSPIK